MRYRVSRTLLEKTFELFRRCGAGRRECQALWISRWETPPVITDVVHPNHSANAVGFSLDNDWLSGFWSRLAEMGTGIRVQIHTHPGAAFHSATDDAYPIVFSPAFLSLVIPNFGVGSVGFQSAYLAEIQDNGTWREVPIHERLEVV